MELQSRVKSRNFTLAVIGLGRVGLPLSLVFASKGVNVTGVDVNPDTINNLERGVVTVREEGIEELFNKALENRKFSVTTDAAGAINKADVVIVTVGTPLTQDLRPNFSQLYQALGAISSQSLEGKLIVLRSTVPPGTTEGVTCKFLKEKTGLEPGRDFYLAYCPERILEGKAIEELENLPEIIGGVDSTSSAIAAELFKLINPEKRMIITSPKVAELAKLFTNIYRYVNFALANQFALIAEHYGTDAHEAIRAANEDYKRSNIPLPGPSGGPCLYKDGYMLNYTPFIDFIKSAWHLNESIPLHIVNRIKGKVGSLFGLKVALLGLAFKADIDDTRQSPAIKLLNALKAEGCEVVAHDPHVSSASLESALSGADVVVLAVNHSKFKDLTCQDISKLAKPNSLLVDCWGFFKPSEAEKAGMRYVGLGRGQL
ncbi:MAG: nucleotide sugar dehydrogenase [Candidatus Hodarchaeaceae archaeon]|nr:nucleotide sugar dehydrogenase [Candidatus Hodarchaeaceae archaeon]